MIRPLLLIIAFAALVIAPAGAAEQPCTDADTGELDLAEQQVYIHQAETKVGNLGATGATGMPGWSEDAPAQSVTEGAGGGYLGTFADWLLEQNDEVMGLTVEGTFSGCLDTMLIDLYAFLPTNRTGTSGELNESPFNGMVSLEIDGEVVGWPAEIEMETIPNPDGDATYRLRYAYTDVLESMLDWGLDPEADHEVRLNVVPRFANTSNAIFVYDTTEVPAGILFNGTPDETYTTVSAF